MKTNRPKLSAAARLSLLALCCHVAALACSGSPVPPAPAPHSAEMAEVTRADGEFALHLYRQLAKEQSAENLFLSPYSVSRALGIALEGADGETAAQMGEVLGFQDAARTSGAENSTRPWNMLIIDKSQAALTSQINQSDVPKSVRDRIQKLRRDLDAANAQAQSLMKSNKYREAQQASVAAEKLADQLNKL